MIVATTNIRPRYADTDQMRMVYYGKYFEYFEQGRSDLLRGIGMPYPEIERLGIFLPVVEAHARYLRPARYDELISIRTTCREAPQSRIRIEYEIYNVSTELIAEGYTIHSFLNASTGRPTRPPQAFLQALTTAFGQTRQSS